MALAAITIGGVTLGLKSILIWLVIGLIAGFLASKVVRGRGLGIVGDIIVGLFGALVGGFIASLVHLSLGLGSILDIPLGTVIIAFLGACLLLLIIHALTGQGRRR